MNLTSAERFYHHTHAGARFNRKFQLQVQTVGKFVIVLSDIGRHAVH